MNIRSSFLSLLALAVCGLGAGCSPTLSGEAQRSDGLLDFAGALAGHPRRDVVPVERLSDRAGEIVTARAEAVSPRETRVSGTVRNGFGFAEVRHAHVDVKVLGAGNRLVAALATDYFPRPIPVDYRGQPRRGSFSARLPFVPAAGSTIQVAFHHASRGECEFNRLNPPGRTAALPE